MKKHVVTSFQEYVNESVEIKKEEYTNIEIEKDDDSIEVNYQTNKYGVDMEISGSLDDYYTGKNKIYKFEPDWFNSDETEKKYSEHCEEIDEEIINKYFNK